jgi:putative ABC transport system permease protein
VRSTDLLIMPVAALWQQKLRTMLTTLGVVFGAFVLAASLSIGEGVQETIDRESRRHDFSRKITVFPNWEANKSKARTEVEVEGTMSPERRERIRKALEEQHRDPNSTPTLTAISAERLDKLAGLPHVERVVPIVNDSGVALLGNKPEGTGIYSGIFDDEAFAKRIIAGRAFQSTDERAVLVSEMLAYRIGLVNDSDLQQVIGKPLRLEIRGREVRAGFDVSINKAKATPWSREEQLAIGQLAAQLPGALGKLDLTDEEIEVLREAIQAGPVAEPEVCTENFPVVGVFREATEAELEDSRNFSHANGGLILPHRIAADFYFRESGRREQGVNQAALFVDSEKNVKEVVKLIEGLGLGAQAAIEFIERERLTYILIFGGMTCVAGVALLVSALGIANTMLMSVLERRREIGIMKAVGADNRHLQLIFLIEGALIGAVGAVFGLLLAWSASFPGDTWVRSMVQRDMKIELKGSIFVFPGWIALTVVGFTMLITTLAALYPARHASRVDPVKALRHE